MVTIASNYGIMAVGVERMCMRMYSQAPNGNQRREDTPHLLHLFFTSSSTFFASNQVF